MKIYSRYSYTIVRASDQVRYGFGSSCTYFCIALSLRLTFFFGWGLATLRNHNLDREVDVSRSSNRRRDPKRIRMSTRPREGSDNWARTDSAAISRFSWHLRLRSFGNYILVAEGSKLLLSGRECDGRRDRVVLRVFVHGGSGRFVLHAH